MSTKAYLYTGHSVLRIIKQDVYCINGKNMRSCKDCTNCDSPTNYHGKARCGTDIERTTKGHQLSCNEKVTGSYGGGAEENLPKG